MTGDPRRDDHATPKHFESLPVSDYVAEREVREAKQRAEARDLIRADWLITMTGERLHYAELSDDEYVDMDDWRQLGLAEEGTDGRFRLACGRTVTYISIPGLLSRMSLPRCSRCCNVVGIPRGKGSPKNSDECRRVLGIGGGLT